MGDELEELTYQSVELDEIGVSEGTSGPTREKSFEFSIAVIRLYKRLQGLNE